MANHEGKGLPVGAVTAPGEWRTITRDYGVVCTRFATVPLHVPVVLGRGTTLIDAGIADTPSRAIGPALADAGHDVRTIDQVVLTHGHHDHFGGLADLKDLAPHVEVAAGGRDVRWIEDHDRYWRDFLRPYASPESEDAERAVVAEQGGREVAVERILEPGDTISTEGAGDLRTVTVHGCHSAGSLAFYYERDGILATGDALQAAGTPFTDGTEAFPIYTDIQAYERMLTTFEELGPRVIVDSHRGVLAGDAVTNLIAACRRFTRVLPDQVLELFRDDPRPLDLATAAHRLQSSCYPAANRTVQLYMTIELHLQALVREGELRTQMEGSRKTWRLRGAECADR